MSRYRIAILFLLVFSGGAFGEIIPVDRRITWQGNVGIPGGITNRTIFANVRNAPYNATGNGTTDDRAAIQSAITACPSGQSVYVPTGTYRINSALSMKSGVTLKGDGPGLTVLNGFCAGGEVVGFGLLGDSHQEQYVFGSPGAAQNVTAGTSIGSSNITVASASGMSVGNFLNIDVINDTNNLGVVPIGNEGFQNTCGRTPTRMLGQIVLVTAISGTSITFDPPLVWYMTNTPQAVPYPCITKYAGVEDLTVFNNNTGGDNCFSFYSVAYCWIKNIESGWADGDHLCVDSSIRCEIRDSYFHDAYLHGPGTHDACLRLQCHSSGVLVENNIMRRMHVGIMPLGGGANGGVIAYNFMTNQFDSGGTTAMFADITFHGAHTMMVLIEGNVMNFAAQDGVWGTTTHGTFLRNYISAQDWVWPPFTGRGPEQTNTLTKQVASVRAINLAGIGNSKWFNIVGNVLGSVGMGNTPAFNPIYMVVAPQTRNWDHEGYIFTFGYAGGIDDGSASGDNALPFTTLINHGNWDIVTRSQMFSNNISDHVIPNSYYLAGKPAFFGNLTWPPVEPSTGVTNLTRTSIPAQYRFVNGSAPTAGDPTITVQPANQTAAHSQTATFSVTALGNTALSYQWSWYGTNVTGATSVNFTTPALVVGNNGSSVFVTVTDTAGSLQSSTATLTVTSDVSISAQPQNQTVTLGTDATFTVTASGGSTLHYQWKFNGGNVGTDSSTYTRVNCQAGDSGAAIRVTVTDTFGQLDSSTATLTVTAGGGGGGGTAPPGFIGGGSVSGGGFQ